METVELHCNIKNISRTNAGSDRIKSVVAAAAYRSGTSLLHYRNEKQHDYTARGGIVHTELLVPEKAPAWAHDRETFWNKVEATERRSDARLAKEMEFSFPRDIPPAMRIKTAQEIAGELVGLGLAVDIGLHSDPGEHNPHCHMLISEREIGANGFSGKKFAPLTKKDFIHTQRKLVAEKLNAALEAIGSNVRVEHKSFKARGVDRTPTRHRGVNQQERAAKREHNRQVQLAQQLAQEVVRMSDADEKNPPKKMVEDKKQEIEAERQAQDDQRRVTEQEALRRLISSPEFKQYVDTLNQERKLEWDRSQELEPVENQELTPEEREAFRREEEERKRQKLHEEQALSSPQVEPEREEVQAPPPREKQPRQESELARAERQQNQDYDRDIQERESRLPYTKADKQFLRDIEGFSPLVRNRLEAQLYQDRLRRAREQERQDRQKELAREIEPGQWERFKEKYRDILGRDEIEREQERDLDRPVPDPHGNSIGRQALDAAQDSQRDEHEREMTDQEYQQVRDAEPKRQGLFSRSRIEAARQAERAAQNQRREPLVTQERDDRSEREKERDRSR